MTESRRSFQVSTQNVKNSQLQHTLLSSSICTLRTSAPDLRCLYRVVVAPYSDTKSSSITSYAGCAGESRLLTESDGELCAAAALAEADMIVVTQREFRGATTPPYIPVEAPPMNASMPRRALVPGPALDDTTRRSVDDIMVKPWAELVIEKLGSPGTHQLLPAPTPAPALPPPPPSDTRSSRDSLQLGICGDTMALQTFTRLAKDVVRFFLNRPLWCGLPLSLFWEVGNTQAM